MHNDITGWVLAGGRGTRMGRVDKGLQPFRGATLVAHVLARLAPQVDAVAINANRNLEQYGQQALAAGLDCPVLPDSLTGFEGPLAGLQTGLRQCATALLLTSPCDSPFLPDDLASRLLAALRASDADLALAVTLEPDEHGNLQRQPHPVFALLKASLAPQLDAYLATGARRMESWFKTLNMVEVVFDQAEAFRNINTLGELQRHEPAPAAAAAPVAAPAQAPVTTPAAATALPLAGARPGYNPDAMPVAQAQQLIASLVQPLDATEQLPLRGALDRVLARDIVSAINVPAWDNSAMDGYALRGADLPATGSVTLKVIGSVYAGRPSDLTAGAGECLRIMTGGVIPAGCDTVVPQELTSAGAADGQAKGQGLGQGQHQNQGQGPGAIVLAAGLLQPGANLRRAGEDLAAGGVALAAGKLLRPADLGLIASLGLTEVTVKRRLRVAFFSTGDELRSAGKPLDPGSVYDSNRYTLYGMLARLGCDPIDMGVVRDDPDALEAALRSACEHADVVLTSGGVSVGAADYTRAIMDRLGDVAFWKLNMRPGRPLAFGRIASAGRAAWLFGLPGNPVAVMVSFYFFARPALLRMMGSTAAPLPPLRARAQAAIGKRAGRTEYQRGILSADEHGAAQVCITGAQGSGILRSMALANCMVLLRDDQGNVAAGDMVEVLPFDGLV